MSLRDWIKTARERGASDLLLEAEVPAVIRVRGELLPMGEPIASDRIREAAREVLDDEQWADFRERGSVDLSLTIAGTRCRFNFFKTARGTSGAVRLLSSFQANLRDCNLHPDFKALIENRTGLILLSGPTGSGKSTTLAALLGEMNATQRRNVISIESPIEYYFPNRLSYIRQREVGSHTPSFEQAIVDSMRENPDVLVIGEMRTPDVMRLTLNAAETGHLVIATMHSSTAAEALTRLCMSFPAEGQAGIRAQLADCLVGVVCQRLTYLPKYELRVPHCEVLLGTTSARATIRTGQFSQIVSVIQTGGEEGMWTFERYRRWIDQKSDWVWPAQAQPLEERPALVQRVESEKLRKQARAPKVSDADRLEIITPDEDLEDLARRISTDQDE